MRRLTDDFRRVIHRVCSPLWKWTAVQHFRGELSSPCVVVVVLRGSQHRAHIDYALFLSRIGSGLGHLGVASSHVCREADSDSQPLPTEPVRNRHRHLRVQPPLLGKTEQGLVWYLGRVLWQRFQCRSYRSLALPQHLVVSGLLEFENTQNSFS